MRSCAVAAGGHEPAPKRHHLYGDADAAAAYPSNNLIEETMREKERERERKKVRRKGG
jgi:hypothetical protein